MVPTPARPVNDTNEALASFYAKVDELESVFIDRLGDAIKIPSISAYADNRKDVFAMSEWVATKLKAVGVEVTLKDLGKQEGTDLDLPPLVLGRYGSDPEKPTVLVYSHYDVQPASIEDGWKHEPFVMTVEEDGKICGRGTSDDKGPLIGWINMIEAFQKVDVDVPANLVFCFEGMEETASFGLRQGLEDEADKYFKDVDVVCITDVVWVSDEQISVPQGLRGIIFYLVTITGAKVDAHSGGFGGQISEPMTDMVNIMSSLVDANGKILVPGIYDNVQAVTKEEYESYQKLNISEDSLYGGTGGRSLHDNQADALVARWKKPSLSLHRIENALPGAGAVTSIPAKLVGKFSIRTVPFMKWEDIDQLVRKHVKDRFESLGSKNELEIECHPNDWFYEEASHWNYQAAIQATRNVWGVDPALTCEGGSIPIALDFKKTLKKNVLLMPVGRPTDGQHSTNEKLDKSNYINAIKLYGAYLKEVTNFWHVNTSSNFHDFSTQHTALDLTIDFDLAGKVDFETTKNTTGLQWFSPSQTDDKEHPFMSSGVPESELIFPPITDTTEQKTYRFKMEIPISNYLFAVASGNLAGEKIGPKSYVYCAPGDLEACKQEFQPDLQAIIKSAENIIFEYPWPLYNLVVLPRSFHLGGMENPIFNFYSATVVSGDRENISVVAHEFAHSYSGNLVTNASWEHFWLNEGWTVWTERNIVRELRGDDEVELQAIVGWQDLIQSIEMYGGEDSVFTSLVLEFEGKRPDDIMSKISYEKGYTFLCYLEETVGREKWLKFVPYYFRTFYGAAVDSSRFKDCVLKFFSPDAAATSSLGCVDWNSWFHKPGAPPKPGFCSELYKKAIELADQWGSLSVQSAFRPSGSDVEGWTAGQVLVFLDLLIESPQPIPLEYCKLLDELYDVGKSSNLEVVTRYLRVALRAGDRSVLKQTEDILGQTGRMKFVRPL
ncbi:peptidase family M20/M25/M40 [Colletotrichum tamarilloi]|uniref:Peptidase family M20/M25/M40 n=1 Tax=Colletotrichum tamarilloi TaxID=1209934 RepID=A0ABQ9QN81_9PEZI|nr:peptidase family M20/M25/M40 [Colletotrichum tamarilloi]KAK1479057.1 peptidase family M20/M25/M40 [Colletotrichum tamarilloi]